MKEWIVSLITATKKVSKVMSVRFVASACLAVSAGMIGSVAAAGTGASEMNFAIHGRVKTICRAEMSSSGQGPSAGVVPVGTISELCNNVQGYSVKLTYAPELGGKTVKIDAQQVVLSATGETVIYESSEPDARNHDVALLADVTDLSPYHIAVAITPKGAVY